MMLIEFIPNPDFKPPQPQIGAGSVVSINGGEKCVVTKTDNTTYPFALRSDPETFVGWRRACDFLLLPERVSGISHDGEWEYAPLDLPTPTYSWDDYPPRAGMVVEWEKRLCVLLGCEYLRAYKEDGAMNGEGHPSHFIKNYCPRPDLMPRFVEGGR